MKPNILSFDLLWSWKFKLMYSLYAILPSFFNFGQFHHLQLTQKGKDHQGKELHFTEIFQRDIWVRNIHKFKVNSAWLEGAKLSNYRETDIKTI